MAYKNYTTKHFMGQLYWTLIYNKEAPIYGKGTSKLFGAVAIVSGQRIIEIRNWPIF